MKTKLQHRLIIILASSSILGAYAVDDYLVTEEHWYGGTAEGWKDSDPSGRMDVDWSSFAPGGHGLEGFYGSQAVPFPETDAFVADAFASGGDFTGDYRAGGLVPHEFNFKFFASDVLPSSLLLRFLGVDGGVSNTFFTALTTEISSTEEWQYLEIPLQYDNNVWTGGDGASFSNSLSDVRRVEIRVTRSGTGAQAYYVDDFELVRYVPPAIAIIDTDGDGLPDYWEEAYFGDPTNAVPGVDSDGDLNTNGQEFEAGTDPTEILARLAVNRVRPSGNWEVIFNGESGRKYEVQTSADPVSDPWTVVKTGIRGIPAPMSVTFYESDPVAMFRVSAESGAPAPGLAMQHLGRGTFLELQFEGEQGREYEVESTDDPINGPWTVLNSGIPGSGSLMSVTVTNSSASSTWFRIRARKAP